MNDDDVLQAYFDSMSRKWFDERSRTQMTLGGLISALEKIDPSTAIDLGHPHSYRGYYSDLALEPRKENTAGGLLALCRAAMGRVFTGWKGGEFPMHENTPMWVAREGSTGNKLMTVSADGTYETEEESE